MRQKHTHLEVINPPYQLTYINLEDIMKEPLLSNSTQNDWEVRFNDRFLNNWGTLLDIKHFIRKELADARREVIQRVMSVLPLGDDPRYRELKDVLAALKEEIL